MKGHGLIGTAGVGGKGGAVLGPCWWIGWANWAV